VSLAVHHSASRATTAHRVREDIFQVSTMSALIAGDYDGETSYAEVMQHGDFGVGTFNALDGEMAALDGDFYHLYADGSVAEVDPDDLTPFAAVTFFRADAEINVDAPHTRTELLARVDATLPSDRLFYAVRIDGFFSTVTTRTVARQSKPYPRLVAATSSQVERTYDDIAGTLVGFRAPAYAQGTTVAGYHLHFIADTRTMGGHVLDFELVSGVVAIDRDTDLHVEMPASRRDPTTGNTADIAAEIVRAENSR
jgi:acetolactate decarboxylase